MFIQKIYIVSMLIMLLTVSSQADVVFKKSDNHLHKLSFYAWDGVSNYNGVLNLLPSNANPDIYLNPVEKGSSRHFIANVEKIQKAGSNVWYLMSGKPNDSYIKQQILLIAQFNDTHAKKILGMSFDSEPWTKFSVQNSYRNRERWREYLRMISYARDLLHEHHLKISVAIPFWLNTIPEAFPNGREINHEVVDIADETIIMDYTIYLDRFYKFAKDTLDYASAIKNKKVKIALEMRKTGEPNVSFYAIPERIKAFLSIPIRESAFSGYILHTLDDFKQANIRLHSSRPSTAADSSSDEVGSPTVWILSNNLELEDDIDVSTVNITNSNATDTDGDGDNDFLIVPGEGRWRVDNITGNITFMPEAGFMADPTPITYNIKDYTGQVLSNATETIPPANTAAFLVPIIVGLINN